MQKQTEKAAKTKEPQEEAAAKARVRVFPSETLTITQIESGLNHSTFAEFQTWKTKTWRVGE